MNNKFNRVIISLIILVAFLLMGYFLVSENFLQKIKDDQVQEENKQWTLYHDKNYGYTVEYPSGLNIQEKHKETVQVAENLGGGSFIVDGGVNFQQADGYGVIDVSIFENSALSSPNDWLVKESQKFEKHRPVVEKEILIDGYNAIVMHEQSDYEIEQEYYPERTTVFIKDGMLFKIWTRFSDNEAHERVWDNFSFVAN